MVQEDASFLTWADTLHPEAAATTIAPGALQTHRNPLEVVYHEIRSDDRYYSDLPVAVNVVAVDDDNDSGVMNNNNDFGQPQHRPNGNTNAAHNQAGDANNSSQQDSIPRPMPWRHSGTIDLILGFVFSFVALLTTVKLELIAFIIYALAAGFHLASERLFGNPATLLFKSIFGVVSAALMIVDSVLLMVNVLVTEILGGIALLLCTFFGGPRSGTEWHQFIRRTCHLVRWGIRRCSTTGWKPERIFPISEHFERASLQPSNRPSMNSHASYDQVGYSQELQSQDNGDWEFDGHDDATMSTLTTATTHPSELPPVTVAAENVHVLDYEARNHDDSADGYFTKNTQEVTID